MIDFSAIITEDFYEDVDQYQSATKIEEGMLMYVYIVRTYKSFSCLFLLLMLKALLEILKLAQGQIKGYGSDLKPYLAMKVRIMHFATKVFFLVILGLNLIEKSRK